MCTYKDCRTPDQLYDRRTDWIHHEDSHHRTPYGGHLGDTGPETADTERDSGSQHISQLPSTITPRVVTSPRDAETSCPICGVSVAPFATFQNHVALHLERLAVVSFPRSTSADEGASNDAVSNNANFEQDSRDEESDLSTTSALFSNPEEDQEEAVVNIAASAEGGQPSSKPSDPLARWLDETGDLGALPTGDSAPSLATRPGAPEPSPELRPFDEPFGFRIKHIEAIPDVHSAGLRFSSSRWKPPTLTSGVRLVRDVKYQGLPQTTMFLWRPNPNLVVTRIPVGEESYYSHHKTCSLFWATDSGTYMHVPFDCTQRHVEDPEKGDSEREDEIVDEDDSAGEEPRATKSSAKPQLFPETWRRLRFYLHHQSGQPTISRLSYAGGHFLDGKMPLRWQSTLIPSVHSVHKLQSSYSMDSQLAGDLPTLLGLVAFCHADNNHAIGAIATWFPPSKGTTDWGGAMSAPRDHPMQTFDES